MYESPFILSLEHSIKDSGWRNPTELYALLVGKNTGNLAFHHAIYEQLNIKKIPWGSQLDVINSADDMAIISCANQIRSHLDLGALSKKNSKQLANQW